MVKTSSFLSNANRYLCKIVLKNTVSRIEGHKTIEMLVILLIERRLLERLGASKTEDMESVGESETFLTPEIGMGVPLAT